jgi:serpin B
MKEFAEDYGDDYYQDPLKIANAIFVGHDVTLKQSFADQFSQYYSGTAMTVDFSSQEAVDLVNQWASDHTEGLISDIIDRFDPRTVAAIANAIYFSDRWDTEFNPDLTVEEVFYLRPGHLSTSPTSEVKVPFMVRDGGIMDYYEDENVQAVNLPFATGGGMTIILPKGGDATGLLKTMTSEYYDTILKNTHQATGKLMLPRFSFDSGLMDLKGALEGLGVTLFDESLAPLTGGLLEEPYEVWVEKAVQKAVIEVDEKGTTAAAVTLMIMAGNSVMMPPAETFEMICDRPFVFVLYGRTYDGGNQVLFTGVVNEP